MIIVMESDATSADVEHVVDRLRDIGAEAHVSRGQVRFSLQLTLHRRPYDPGSSGVIP